jgi:hypothetical protein
MSEWKRTTKELTLETLPVEIATAIHRHVEKHNLGPILDDALMWIQTDSQKMNKGLFGGTQAVQMAAVITPRWLVWSVDESKTDPVVLSAQLIDVTVQDYAQTPFAEMVPDSGIQVNGLFTGAAESASAFIGLEQEAAGDKFKKIVIQAAADAKK